MEKLKACPFCGSTNVEISPYGGAKAVACMDCFCRSEIFEGENAKEKAIAAWNRRAEPENKALTLEELKQMNGMPIWVIGKRALGTDVNGWMLITTKSSRPAALDCTGACNFGTYGKMWIAYARKPEGSEKTLTTQEK